MSNGINCRKRSLRGYQYAPMLRTAINSPPYYPPAQIHRESAVRFHQTPRPSYPSFQFDQPQYEANASFASNVSALASPCPAPAVLLPGPNYEEPPPEPEHERDSPLVTDEGNHLININDNADGVYLLNCHADSYSTVIADEEQAAPAERAQTEAQLELALMHLRKARELSNQPHQTSIYQCMDVGPSAPMEQQISKHDQDEKDWQQDLKQRNVMRQVKAHVRAGGSLFLECMAPSNYAVQCASTECIQPARLVPLNHFYITIQGSGEPHIAKHFCLVCLEQLWNGHGMQIPLEDAAVFPCKRRKSKATDPNLVAPSINLDGQGDIVNERRDSALSLGDDDLACHRDAKGSGNRQKGHELCNNQFNNVDAEHAGKDVFSITTEHLEPPHAAGSDFYHSKSHNTTMCGMRQSGEYAEVPPEESTFDGEQSSGGQPVLLSSHCLSSSDIMSCEAPTSRRTSQNSTHTDGNWRCPPTRFQRLAGFFQPGNNITARDKAILHLWKDASKDQLRWQDHLERTEKLRRKFAGLLSEEEEDDDDDDDWLYADVMIPGNLVIDRLEDSELVNKNMKTSHNGEGEDRDDEDQDIIELAGFTMKQCYGMDLSTALALSGGACAARD